MAVSQKPSPLWNVPYGRNRFFTERDDELHILYQELQMRDAIALSQPRAITGLGGIGKTQMALEYAYRYGSKYAAVLWVRAASSSELTSSFMDLARALNLPEANEQDQNIIVEAVLRWLHLHTGWLLIFDNMDDPSIAEPFLPNAGSGHLLFTTRAQALSNLAQCVEVQQMKPEIGALLLLRRAEILPLQATLELAGKDDRTVASDISRELDGLPLALDQAGAYVKATFCSLEDYLTLYRTRRQNLLQKRGSFDQNYPASVATTWSLSFEKVRQANPAATELLNFCAFLAPDAIPETIITKGAHHLGDVLAPVVTDPIQLDLICKEVLRYSLFQREADASTLSIHRLVQAVLQDNLPSETRTHWKQRVVLAVNATFPYVEFENWPILERLLPHALICATWIEQASLTTRKAARLLNQSGLYLKDRAQYREAEPLLKRALAIYEQELGATHPDTATSLNNLATLYDNQGRLSEAEQLFQRSVAISTQKLGATHPDTARSLNNLALLYKRQGKYVQAEQLFQRALAICEQKLGATHPDTMTSLNTLAGLYQAQGKYAKAEPLLKRALAIREQQLGATHPNAARSLNNLAGLYCDQGKYQQAEPLYVRALAIREQQLGATHPDTAQSLNNLASLYYNQGKYEQAEPLYVRVLAIDEQVYGLDHAEVATDLNNIAELYKAQGKYAKAEPLYERALAIREQQLGPQHPSTAQSLSNLAGLYGIQGKYEQAEPLYVRALAIREQRLGAVHPSMAISLHNLARLYQAQERYSEAEPLYRRALRINEQALGLEHPNTLITRRSYAAFLRTIGHEKKAKKLEEKL